MLCFHQLTQLHLNYLFGNISRTVVSNEIFQPHHREVLALIFIDRPRKKEKQNKKQKFPNGMKEKQTA